MTLKSALMTELAARGHHVTVVKPFPEKDPVSNYKDIVMATDVSKLGNNIIYVNNYDRCKFRLILKRCDGNELKNEKCVQRFTRKL